MARRMLIGLEGPVKYVFSNQNIEYNRVLPGVPAAALLTSCSIPRTKFNVQLH